MTLFIGTDGDGERVHLTPASLLRHMVCLGSSGSGKTVAAKVVCEEMIRQGRPVIAVDPQGDIASLCLPADPAEIEARGVPATRLDAYRDNAEVVIWTPASSAGVPLMVNPLRPVELDGVAHEDRVRTLAQVAQSLAAVLGYELDNEDGQAAAGVLHLVLEHVATHQLRVSSFERLGDLLGELPDGVAERAAQLMTEARLQKLRRKVSLLAIGAGQLLFGMGVPLSIPRLLGLAQGDDPNRTRLSVVYLNTLHNQAEKDFVVAQLAQQLYDWMLDNPATEPQALFYIDEVAPFLPPVRKPACKDALQLLLKQARKYGVACLLASQNPGDIDYKSLAQVSTWALGRMMVRQDIKKVERTIRAIAADDTEAIVAALPTLAPGQFRVLSPDNFEACIELQVRWLLTEHRTLDEEEVARVVDPTLKQALMAHAPPPAADPPLTLEADEAAPGAGAEPAGAAEETPEDRLDDHLRHARCALTVAELAEQTGLSEGAVRRALKALEAGKQLVREKAGRSYYHWHKSYRFYPDHGVTGPVQVARLAVFERDALAAATKATSSLFGLFGKTLEAPVFEHLALWQLGMTVTVTTGMLFWKDISHRGEYLYFHARTGDLLIADKSAGIRFVSVVDQAPGEIRDLDDVCAFEDKTPDEVGLDKRALRKILPVDEIIERAQRKFPIKVESSRLTFLPYWRFPVASENRHVTIDGVVGGPLALE